jgi:hypothetical protein
MGDIVTVYPGDCGSDWYRDSLRPKTEIIDFYFSVRRCGLVSGCDAW